MKILIPAVPYRPTLSSPRAEIFCIAKAFIIFDTTENAFYTYENRIYSEPEIHVSEYMNALGVNHIVTDCICVSCYKDLERANIKIWKDTIQGSINIRESFQKFLMGSLERLDDPVNRSLHIKKKSSMNEGLMM
ncbi:MAG: hypothetical protein INQ03_16145 [Candidatus Heimdallarchaeota archaeon]|nr:hypothetical protein [Candidatus Heimdallarchaeota archaeon]